MSPLIYRSVGKIIKLLRRTGLDIHPTTTRAGGFNGMLMQWRPDEPETPRGVVVTMPIADTALTLFVANDLDVIQSRHRRGAIYEPEELAIIARHFFGGCFLDVGSNVGNHALYAAKVLGASRVIAFEPQPVAARILEINVALNNLADRITVHRLGLSNRAGTAALRPLNNNLGATRLVADDDAGRSGGVPLAIGDDLLDADQVDFIKIDTEGFEIPVLDGLRQTIVRCKPALFVEVENGNVAGFEQFCGELGYRITETFRRYDSSVNMLAVAD
jgi:FkbM family methyltransferase